MHVLTITDGTLTATVAVETPGAAYDLAPLLRDGVHLVEAALPNEDHDRERVATNTRDYLLGAGGLVSAREVAGACGYSLAQVRRAMRDLGAVKVGDKRGARYALSKAIAK